MLRRSWILVAGAAVLAGCSTVRTVVSDVSSYGSWPAGRAPGSYAFERLPSQQSQPETQARLEEAARGALQQAGFTAAADAGSADVTVQLGARITRADRSPWDDPFWWGWGGGYWRHPGWRSGWGMSANFSAPYYLREVAVLIRDRRNGTPLYEARATNDSNGPPDDATLAAMFRAALTDFPTPAVNPRRVSVPLDQ